MIKFLKRDNAPDLAYVQHKGESDLPCVMFLGGFRSDMAGTKAIYLEEQCKARRQSFIRFDYRGHGKSEGEFEEACISEWTQDAADILHACTSFDESVILVGSSMGGWVSLLLARQYPKRVQALIGLAAAPDFTTWMDAGMSADQRALLNTQGYFELPNDYDDTPYIISKKLIEDGRDNVLLTQALEIQCPVRLIQGKQDADVPWKTAEDIKGVITGNDVQITYIDDADHRLSSPDQLAVLKKVLINLF